MKHILVINPNNDTYSNPTLVSVFEALLETNDFKITLLAPQQIIAKPKHFHQINELILTKNSVNWSKKIQTWLPKLKHILQLIKFCQKEKVDLIIGIDPIGLIIGGRIKRLFKNINLHYFSFELFFSDEIQSNPYLKKLKAKEIVYSKHINSLLIQDVQRLQLLVEENKINLDKINHFLIPVSPSQGKIEGENKSFWRQKLGISENKIVLLHSGSLEKWSGGEILIENIEKGIPANVLILIHSKSELNPQNKIHNKLLEFEKNSDSVLIHKTVFSDFREYLSFLQVADFGLVLYQKDESSPYTGKNIVEIGLASGKFSCFMSQGIPVITSNSNYYRKLLSTNKIGFCLNENEFDFKQLSEQNSERMLIFKQNSVSFFDKDLNNTKKIKDFIKTI
jgi:glycosyltransferase involved in cell wall biosynthesis